MIQIIDEIKNAYQSYNTYGFPLVFVYVAVVYLMLSGQKSKRVLYQYTLLSLLLLTLPGILNILLRIKPDKGQTWMIYAIIPGGVICAYALTEYWASIAGTRRRIAAIGFSFFLVLLGIGLNISTERLGGYFNWYRADKQVVEIGKMLEGEKEIRMLAPDFVAEQIREVNPEVSVIYGLEHTYSPQDASYLVYELETYKCNTFVIEKDYETDVAKTVFEQNGFTKSFETAEYAVFQK